MINKDGKGRFMSEDRRLWIADWFLLYVITEQVCVIKGFHHQNCVGGWIFVFSSWMQPTQRKKVKKQENQLEVVATVSTTEIGNVETLNEMWAELTGWTWCKQKKKGCQKFSWEVRDKSVSFFQFLISMRSDLPHPLSLLPVPLLRNTIRVGKVTKYNLATLSERHSFSLEICLSASLRGYAWRNFDSPGEGLQRCWDGMC